ncbi:MAG: UDP-N-acetylenolpyruvoylglucosamine reductase [Candidatus Portnoybacteria bacterium RBG_19FT_COMBO_36_7]|uniref:UDP-N-acetylenolpyruvoylglucosamine reductase n=1 Tax=Candidatus Portnoybacteria bacterium RBG_19FT_COMBO_36_7 TaxID=1801992 RepID=A0A1G2F8G8_9BACT|nr:MAG: UDP-N-acetylenolpyruvoylglucosamine reductase [Candidatus Portnoybacteria bacterium RBG_19FT_COMBO_36_7]
MTTEDKFKKNELLANHTTLRIGGPAKYFFEAKEKKELIEALKWAKENSVPYFILGGGSNLLVSDKGFDGLVIKVRSEKLKVKSEGSKYIVEVEAGVPLIKIILETTKAGYSGAEWGYGIPGTIGGAICGNAGRLGQDISQVIESVIILDENLAEKELNKEDCRFTYRESVFKKNGWIILSATLVLKKKEQKLIDDILDEAKKVVKGYPPFPSAGCAFKNYEIKNNNGQLPKEHPELESQIRGGKIGTGYLIDACGLKQKQIGGAKIWEGHANYIINTGNARAEDVISLIDICKKSVKEKFGIELEEEIRLLGF